MLQWGLFLEPVTTGTGIDEIDSESPQFTDKDFALLDPPLFPFAVITLFGTFSPICGAYPDKEGFVPHALRTRWTRRNGNRIRFERSPPYASTREFDKGERNACKR